MESNNLAFEFAKFLQQAQSAPMIFPKPGPVPSGEAATDAQRAKKHRAKKKVQSLADIAVLDMETDPFDNETQDRIIPFLAVLYADNFEPVTIWDDDEESFIERVISAITNLPRSYTIYAHNGGKFDFLFLISRIRGQVGFKGRGIMSAKIGNHDLRDSFHIIPEKLANFQKDSFDYLKLKRAVRNKHKKEIIKYCINDCRYLLDIVKSFVRNNGFKISIGQAAMALLRKDYKVERLSAGMDGYLRHFFFGGRVQCLQGKGHWTGAYKLYDVNSMYPFVMAHYQHPIGKHADPRRGQPSDDTIFISLSCYSHGALVRRDPVTGDTDAPHTYAQFKTTIWEYNAAMALGLLEDVKIHHCIDFPERSDFSKFILPIYEKRLLTKDALRLMETQGLADTREYIEVKKDDIFYKLYMNNSYGKFAQNPRKFKDYYLTGPGEYPEPCAVELSLIERCEYEEAEKYKWKRHYYSDRYEIWTRPAPRKSFHNVATAASITGAARAMLLTAMHNAIDPIYCDTDSLIAKDIRNVVIDKSALGAWDIEKEMSEVIICGKKLYGYKIASGKDAGKEVIKSKGTAGATFKDLQRMLAGDILPYTSVGPTMTRTGSQNYVTRHIRATAKPIIRKHRHGITGQNRATR